MFDHSVDTKRNGVNLFRSNPVRREKLDSFHKTIRGTTKKCENKKFKLIFIFTLLSEMHGTIRNKAFTA